MQGGWEWGFMVSLQQPSLLSIPPHTFPMLQCGMLCGCSVGMCSTVVLHRLQRIFAPVPGAHPYCLSLTLMFTLVLLTNFFFFLAVLSLWCCFLSFLKYLFLSVPPAWLMGSPVLCHVFGAGCVWWGTVPGFSSWRSSLEPLCCQQIDIYTLYMCSVGNAVKLDCTKYNKNWSNWCGFLSVGLPFLFYK